MKVILLTIFTKQTIRNYREGDYEEHTIHSKYLINYDDQDTYQSIEKQLREKFNLVDTRKVKFIFEFNSDKIIRL